MGIVGRIVLSLVVLGVGSIAVGAISSEVGTGQYLTAGVVVLILIYIYGRSRLQHKNRLLPVKVMNTQKDKMKDLKKPYSGRAKARAADG